MNVNVERMVAEVDLIENKTYIVRDGIIRAIETPPDGFGEQLIMWQNGKPEISKMTYVKKLG